MSQFLKWVGGKTQIIDQVTSNFPKNMKVYREPFLGGGSVLFSVLKSDGYKIGKIEASDINNDLVNCYQVIKTDVESLITSLHECLEKWRNIEREKVVLPEGVNRINVKKHAKYENEEEALRCSREGYYYYLRAKFNKRESSGVEMAMMFIMMNKLCFRGVCRYSGGGDFNVPYGNPNVDVGVYSADNLRSCSVLFQRVNFRCCDFEETLKEAKKGDFIYLDPPYMDNDTEEGINFVGYVANGFTKHGELFEKLKNTKKGVSWIMSNAHNEKLRTVFPECEIQTVEVRRAINSKNPGSQSLEMLVLKI